LFHDTSLVATSHKAKIERSISFLKLFMFQENASTFATAIVEALFAVATVEVLFE